MPKFEFWNRGTPRDAAAAIQQQVRGLPPEAAQVGRIVAAGLEPVMEAIHAEAVGPQRLKVEALNDALFSLYISIANTAVHNLVPVDQQGEFRRVLAERFAEAIKVGSDFETIGGRQ